MNKLIINEYIKILKKRSTYILLIVLFLFVLFTNLLYKYKLDRYGNFIDNIKNEINYIEEAKEVYNSSLNNKEILLSKYIIDNKIDINKINDNRGILINFFSEYELIIVIIIAIMIGSILIDEVNNGTIKNLLVIPYKRYKILLSKYIVSISFIFIIFFLCFLFQLLIGNILFGIEPIKVPVVIYNYRTNNLIIYNIFTYLFINFLAKLPLFIMYVTIILFMNTIIHSNIIVIVVSLLIYSSAPIISSMKDNILIFKYLIQPYWDFSLYLYNDISIIRPIIIYLLYLISLILLSFDIFNKTDIKTT